MSQLSILGLNGTESQVYKLLMVSGQLSKGEIRHITRLSIEQSESAFTTLLDKKLIREVPGIQGRFAAMLPIGNLKDQIEESILNIEALSRELDGASSEVVTSLKSQLESSLAEFTRVLQGKKTEVESGFSTLESSINEEANQAKDVLSQKTTSGKSDISDKVDELKVSNRDIITTQKDSSEKILETQRENITTELETAKSNLETFRGDGKQPVENVDVSSLDGSLTDITSQLDTIQNDGQSSINNNLTNSLSMIDGFESNTKEETEKINQIGVAYITDAKNLGESIKGSIHNHVSENKSTLDKIKNEFTKNQSDGVTVLNGLLEENDSQHAALLSELNTLEQSSIKHKNSTKDNITNQITTSQTEISTHISNMDSVFLEHINTIKTQLDAGISEQVASLTQILEVQFQTALQETKSKLSDFNSSFVTKIDELNANLNTDRSSKVQELNTSLSTKVDTLKESVTTEVSKLNEDEKNSFTTSKDKLVSFKSSFDSKIQESVSSLEGLTETLDKLTSEITASMTSFQQQRVGEVGDVVNKHNEAFQTQYSQALNIINTKLVEEVSNLKNGLQTNTSDLNQNLGSTVQNIKDNLNGQITQIKSQISSIHASTTEKFHTLVDSMVNSLLETTEKTHRIGIEQVENIRNDLNKVEEMLINAVSESLSQVENAMLDTMTFISSDLDGIITGTYDKLNARNSDVKNNAVSALNQSGELVNSGTGNQITAVQNSLGEYNAKYKEVTGKVSEPTSELAKLLGSLQGEVEGTETPKINTSYIVGKEPITQFITDFISRIKSKATLLVPSITYINDEAILALPRTRQITIISYIDEVANKDWIEKMHNATPNITLRSIQTRATGGSLPDFIGIEREQEEILLGTIDDSADDYVAIVSSSTYFVKILGNIVIADYSRGKSKQIQKS